MSIHDVALATGISDEFIIPIHDKLIFNLYALFLVYKLSQQVGMFAIELDKITVSLSSINHIKVQGKTIENTFTV